MKLPTRADDDHGTIEHGDEGRAATQGTTSRWMGSMPEPRGRRLLAGWCRRRVSADGGGARAGDHEHRHQGAELGHRSQCRARAGDVSGAELSQQQVEDEMISTVSGIDIAKVGSSDTVIRNQLKVVNSFHWNGRASAFAVRTHILKKPPWPASAR